MVGSRGRWLALLAPLALLPGPAGAEDAAPSPGGDRVLLADGGTLRCRAGAEADGRIELAFPSGTVRVPKAEILEVRRSEDYDPAPRSDEERKKVAEGQVRWAGLWVSPARRDELLKKDRDREKKLWEDVGAHGEWENRWKRGTKHFAIEADIPRRAVDFYEEQLEGYYEYFTSAFKVSPKRRIPVFIFRTREEFRAFERKDTGQDSENTVGYFTPVLGNEHLALFDWQGNRGETVRVLLHECTHLLMYLANPGLRLPTWINEGLAEYYGACQVSKGKVKRGAIQDMRLLDLRARIEEKGLPEIDTLMAHGHPDRGAPGGKPFDVDDYAHAWAFVHFLFHGAGGKYLPRLAIYLNGHWTMNPTDGVPGSSKEHFCMKYVDDRALLLRCLKAKDYASLGKEFREYVDTLDYAGSAGQAMAGLRTLLTGKDRTRAEASFRAALEKGGDDPETLAIVVRGYAILGDREKEAEALLQKAVDQDPLNLALRYELTGWFPAEDAEIPHLRLCVEMEPGDPVALASLAWLSLRGLERDRWFRAGPEDGAAAGKAEAALAAGGEIPPADCRAMAEALLRTGKAGPALDAARRAANGAPADAEAQALLARAAAVSGDAAEFARALVAFRAARKSAPAEAVPRTETGLDLETSRVLVESASCALAAGKPAEARRAVDGWFSRRGCAPRLEADWILYLGVALETKDLKMLLARARSALQAAPGSERLVTLLFAARTGGLRGPARRGGEDGPAGGDGGAGDGGGGDDGK